MHTFKHTDIPAIYINYKEKILSTLKEKKTFSKLRNIFLVSLYKQIEYMGGIYDTKER